MTEREVPVLAVVRVVARAVGVRVVPVVVGRPEVVIEPVGPLVVEMPLVLNDATEELTDVVSDAAVVVIVLALVVVLVVLVGALVPAVAPVVAVEAPVTVVVAHSSLLLHLILAVEALVPVVLAVEALVTVVAFVPVVLHRCGRWSTAPVIAPVLAEVVVIDTRSK